MARIGSVSVGGFLGRPLIGYRVSISVPVQRGVVSRPGFAEKLKLGYVGFVGFFGEYRLTKTVGLVVCLALEGG